MDHQDPEVSNPDPPNITDWISAICSAIAAAISLITLLTVYVAARQLLTEHKAYEVGLSREALGPWKAKVKTKRLFGLQQIIATPVISASLLLRRNWQPDFKFPTGFQLSEDQDDLSSKSRWTTLISKFVRRLKRNQQDDSGHYVLVDTEMAPARSTWVNFMQALDISPEKDRLYHMNAQSILVNGLVPMRWRGKDLCTIASILGFKSCEQSPQAQSPMPLPMQWNGPIGYLQFRPSDEGCVVEFLPPTWGADLLSETLYDFYDNAPSIRDPNFLAIRLWCSIRGLRLRNGKILYLSRAGATTPATWYPGDCKEGEMIFHLLEPCPALLLSNIVDCEIAFGNGLDIRQCVEYVRSCASESEAVLTKSNNGELWYPVKPFTEELKERFPYTFGVLRMDLCLLKYIKEVVELLKPDGYYFSAPTTLLMDVSNIFNAVYSYPRLYKDRCFPRLSIDDLPDHPHRDAIYHAMLLCNECQFMHSKSQAFQVTIDDTAIISKASEMLRKVVKAPADLSWAMLVCPDLFTDLADMFEEPEWLKKCLEQTVMCKEEILDGTELLAEYLASKTHNNDDTKHGDDNTRASGVGSTMSSRQLPSNRSSSNSLKSSTEQNRNRGDSITSNHSDHSGTDNREQIGNDNGGNVGEAGNTNNDDDQDEATSSSMSWESINAPCPTYSVPLCAVGEYTGWQLVAAFCDVMITFHWIEYGLESNVNMYTNVIPQTITMC